MTEKLGDIAASYTMDLGFAIIPLKPKSKEPATKHGLKDWSRDPRDLREGFNKRNNLNMGVVLGEPSGNIIVIDIDCDDDMGYDGMEYMRDWERQHGELPETVSAITGRGGSHLYYRTPDRIIKPSVNNEIHIDIRGEGSYAMLPPSIHPNGRAMQWENHPDDFEIADADENVYAFIKSVQGLTDKQRKERFKLPKVITSGKRNDTLFKYACSLQSEGYDDEYIYAAVETINNMRCDKPLDSADIAKIVNSALTYEKGKQLTKAIPQVADIDGERIYRRLNKAGEPTGAVLHNLVARDLIELYRACYVDGAPAVWNDRCYESGWDAISRQIVTMIDDCKIADQKEIRHYVHLKAPRVESAKPWKIAFDNGVLDVDLEHECNEFTDDLVITNIIPHEYHEDAYDVAADKFLDRISNGDKIVRKNLEEVIGVCMYRANDFGQCPVLIGTGANGKSTFISALRNVLGASNVSSLDINVIGKPFQAGRLLGKLANLGDDISNERLNGDILAVFKKVVTGEVIYTDVKNSDGFEFKPYCTMVFSCNELPRLGDSSEGMMRRLFPIPFDARFSPDDADYDPRIIDKLQTESAAQYLIRVGIEGLRRVRTYKSFTENERSKTMVDDVRLENDSVLQWLDDCELDSDWLYGRETSDAYENYQVWCGKNGVLHYGKRKFSDRLKLRFGLRSVPTTRNDKRIRVYK